MAGCLKSDLPDVFNYLIIIVVKIKTKSRVILVLLPESFIELLKYKLP